MNKGLKPILVVEDEAILRDSLRDWLTDEGYQVETAGEGESALKSIAEQDYGVVVLDVRLPGKNGLEVLREARASKPDLKGIIITAYPSVQTAVEAMRAGALDYLPKPFDLNDLEVLIRKNLGTAQIEIKPQAPEKKVAPAPEPVSKSMVQEVIDSVTGKIYLPPCQVACPIGEDIQRTNVLLSRLPLAAEDVSTEVVKIGDEIYEKNPLFPICGYVCGLCEKKCNYKDQTGAVRRRMLKRFIADYYLPYLNTRPAFARPTKEKVAVVGGGPAGLMCAYTLSKRGYRVTILERGTELGGALRYIPVYRLPASVVDSTLNNLARIAHIEVRLGVKAGNDGKTLDELKREGYQSIFIAAGTHSPRPLTFEGHPVEGSDLEGVEYGLYLLSDMNHGKLSSKFYRALLKDKRVLVIGGGNVAFDVARSARRLAADVSVVCLECADKSTRDGIPADVEEVEGAVQEGVKIYYSRGIEEVTGEKGSFKKIKCAKCVSVFDNNGFNPKFDTSDSITIEGDVLLATIGQGAERTFFQQEDLLDARGRLDVDRLTLASGRKQGVFIGGDVRKPGFAAEAMRDGVNAAESIDRYLRGKDMKAGREKQYEDAPLPFAEYKAQPEIEWTPADERMNFALFEIGLTLEEARAEAKRCLHCGPCQSCKACVAMGLQPELPEIEVKKDICSGCGICVSVCNFDATKLAKEDNRRVSVVDALKCKHCGVCVVACPVEARTGGDGQTSEMEAALAG